MSKSQMNGVTRHNLLEFGQFFRKSLIWGIVAAASAVLIIVPIIGWLAILVFVIILLVFQIKMLIQLYRAKESNKNTELDKAFLFIIISICINIGASFLGNFAIGQSVLNIGATVVNLLGWMSLGNYISVYKGEASDNVGFTHVAEGIKLFSILTYVQIGVEIVNLISGLVSIPTFSTIMMVISVIAAVAVIVSQFKIANGLISIFGVPGNYSTEPTLSSTPSVSESSNSSNSGPISSNFCSKCGGKLMDGAKFCPTCGHTLE